MRSRYWSPGSPERQAPGTAAAVRADAAAAAVDVRCPNRPAQLAGKLHGGRVVNDVPLVVQVCTPPGVRLAPTVHGAEDHGFIAIRPVVRTKVALATRSEPAAADLRPRPMRSFTTGGARRSRG